MTGSVGSSEFQDELIPSHGMNNTQSQRQGNLPSGKYAAKGAKPDQAISNKGTDKL
ncbi:MAG: hypothetical protein AAF125_05525 [Chloroflexota bacterium]